MAAMRPCRRSERRAHAQPARRPADKADRTARVSRAGVVTGQRHQAGGHVVEVSDERTRNLHADLPTKLTAPRA